MCELLSNDVTAQCATREAVAKLETFTSRRIRASEDLSYCFECAGSTTQGEVSNLVVPLELHSTKRHTVGAWTMETAVGD